MTAWLATWLTGGRAVDAILVLLAAEAVALLFLHRRTGRGIPPGMLAANLLAGGCLLAALRLGLAGVGWPAVAGCLLLAGGAHGADLRLRWRR